MGTLTIRNLDDRVKKKIRLRAAQKGHSMEEEARRLLTQAVKEPAKEETGLDLANAIRRRFAHLPPLKLELPPRGPMRKPPKFG